MPRRSHNKPRISRTAFWLFSLYSRFYLRRHIHRLRVVGGSFPQVRDDAPVIVCLNHPSWWDPLVALAFANAFFRQRTHYAPIDSEALAKYKLFELLGFYGIELNSWPGASAFLGIGKAILTDPNSVLWITAEGKFTDVRTRPLRLRPGLGHLIHSAGPVTVIPLALEYTYWEERTPEVLACWGSPVYVASGRIAQPQAWMQDIADGLGQAMDHLADLSKTRNKRSFDTLLAGRVGVGGVYDVLRYVSALLKGQHFVRQHGSEDR